MRKVPCRVGAEPLEPVWCVLCDISARLRPRDPTQSGDSHRTQKRFAQGGTVYHTIVAHRVGYLTRRVRRLVGNPEAGAHPHRPLVRRGVEMQSR